ncbi:MAG: phage tail spike protein [Eubacteriales bacterium]|nr:phage tail spike protein [Eubacteriales bacterium]
MYAIKVLTDGATYPLFLSGVADLPLLEPVLTLEMGMQGSLTFRVPRTHPYRDKIRILSSEFYVYQNEEEIFRGRYIGREEDFYLTGAVTCEGDLAYLIDSQQPPYEHQGSIVEFLDARLSRHNSGVEARKRFKRGTVNVTDNNNYINRSNTDYSDTLTCLRDKLVSTHGGYLRTRHAGADGYLDYVYDYGGINEQKIRFGQNMLDITRYLDSQTIITALIPRGAQVEYEDELGETQTRIVDIREVNGGSDYIYDQEAVERYGWIYGVQQWEDVTLPENLLAKAKAYLSEAVSLPATMELQAVDLAMIDVDAERLQLGYWTEVISGPHEITGHYLLTKKVMHLDNPGKDTVTLGGTVASFSSSAAKGKLDISRRVEQTAAAATEEMNRKIENATTLITGGFGGYVVLDNIDPVTGKKMHPWRILIMNAPDKATAQNVIQINQNGIGFSTTGINGPYRNAWTIDGNLVADFVTTGSMLADRIRGGTLEVGGTGLAKDGVITLKSATGEILAIMDKNGLDIRKGSIIGTTIQLGGRGNVSGSMTVNAADGSVICRINADGLYAIAGEIGGWRIGADYLETDQGIIRSFENGNENNRATMNNASFKVWVNGGERCYVGRGGYNGRGSANNGLIFVGGERGVELDGSNGKVNAMGDIQSGGNMSANGSFECGGALTARGNTSFPGGRHEFGGDIFVGGNVWCNNLASQDALEALAGRVSALEQAGG